LLLAVEVLVSSDKAQMALVVQVPVWVAVAVLAALKAQVVELQTMSMALVVCMVVGVAQVVITYQAVLAELVVLVQSVLSGQVPPDNFHQQILQTYKTGQNNGTFY
jgi:hypothetical protein